MQGRKYKYVEPGTYRSFIMNAADEDGTQIRTRPTLVLQGQPGETPRNIKEVLEQ